jgi:hypothetical protein
MMVPSYNPSTQETKAPPWLHIETLSQNKENYRESV